MMKPQQKRGSAALTSSSLFGGSQANLNSLSQQNQLVGSSAMPPKTVSSGSRQGYKKGSVNLQSNSNQQAVFSEIAPPNQHPMYRGNGVIKPPYSNGGQHHNTGSVTGAQVTHGSNRLNVINNAGQPSTPNLEIQSQPSSSSSVSVTGTQQNSNLGFSGMVGSHSKKSMGIQGQGNRSTASKSSQMKHQPIMHKTPSNYSSGHLSSGKMSSSTTNHGSNQGSQTTANRGNIKQSNDNFFNQGQSSQEHGCIYSSPALIMQPHYQQQLMQATARAQPQQLQISYQVLQRATQSGAGHHHDSLQSQDSINNEQIATARRQTTVQAFSPNQNLHLQYMKSGIEAEQNINPFLLQSQQSQFQGSKNSKNPVKDTAQGSTTTTIDLSNEVVQVYGSDNNRLEVYTAGSNEKTRSGTLNEQQRLQKMISSCQNKGNYFYEQPNITQAYPNSQFNEKCATDIKIQYMNRIQQEYSNQNSNNSQMQGGASLISPPNEGTTLYHQMIETQNIHQSNFKVGLSSPPNQLINQIQQHHAKQPSHRTPQHSQFNGGITAKINQSFAKVCTQQPSNIVMGPLLEASNNRTPQLPQQSTQQYQAQQYQHQQQQNIFSPQPKKLNSIANYPHSYTFDESQKNEGDFAIERNQQQQEMLQPYSNQYLIKTYHQQSEKLLSENPSQKDIVLQYHIKSHQSRITPQQSQGNYSYLGEKSNANSSQNNNHGTTTQRTLSEQKRHGATTSKQSLLMPQSQIQSKRGQYTGQIQNDAQSGINKLMSSSQIQKKEPNTSVKGNMSGRQGVLGREMVVQSMRDKDCSNVSQVNNDLQSDCTNPFEIADSQALAIQARAEAQYNNIDSCRPNSKQNANPLLIAQRMARDAPKSQHPQSIIDSSSLQQQSFSFNQGGMTQSSAAVVMIKGPNQNVSNPISGNATPTQPNWNIMQQANNILTQTRQGQNKFGTSSTPLMIQNKSPSDEPFNKANAILINNYAQELNESGAPDTLREVQFHNGSQSGRRLHQQAKSEERTAKGNRLPHVIINNMMSHHHYEEYGVKSLNSSHYNHISQNDHSSGPKLNNKPGILSNVIDNGRITTAGLMPCTTYNNQRNIDQVSVNNRSPKHSIIHNSQTNQHRQYYNSNEEEHYFENNYNNNNNLATQSQREFSIPTEAVAPPTMRRGVSQVCIASYEQQHINQNQNEKINRFKIENDNDDDYEPADSFVMIDSKSHISTRPSAIQGFSHNTMPQQQQQHTAGNIAMSQQKEGAIKNDTSQGGGVFFTNLKNSLFSKITNIFATQSNPSTQSANILNEQERMPDTKAISGTSIFKTASEEVKEEVKPPKYQCSCGSHVTLKYMCKEAFEWYTHYNARAKSAGTITNEEYMKLKRTYQQLLIEPVAKEAENQIQRDLNRTFPLHEYYREGAPGIERMRRVLSAFANYDQQVDYVQGMNFIVGALLYHANEVMAFWLFVSLIEDCEMRDIYMHGLPGLFKHSHIISSLVTSNLTDLSAHFMEHNLKVEMYASDWIFGLFASVIPLEQMGAFFSKFFKHRWIFFYQLILSILKSLEKELLQEDELWNILNQIKSQTFLNSAAIGSQSVSNLSPSAKKQLQRNHQYRNELRQQALKQEKTQQNYTQQQNLHMLSPANVYQQSRTPLNIRSQEKEHGFDLSLVQQKIKGFDDKVNGDEDILPSQVPIETEESQRNNHQQNAHDNRVVGFLKKIFPGFRFGQQDTRDPDEINESLQFWPILIDRCMKEWKEQINEQEIRRMLKNFDPENTQFFGSS